MKKKLSYQNNLKIYKTKKIRFWPYVVVGTTTMTILGVTYLIPLLRGRYNYLINYYENDSNKNVINEST